MILRISIVIMLLTEVSIFSSDSWNKIYSGDFAGNFGKLEVGFRFDDIIDSTRTYDYSEYEITDIESRLGGRPIRLYTWYPADAENEKDRMSLYRYVEISRGDFSIGGQSTVILNKLPIERALPEKQLNSTLMQITKAFENAQPAEGKYPLIVLGQGLYYENPITHFSLCEYLASHGFVVVSCPLAGTNSPLVMLTVRDLESIVRDLEFILKTSLNLPYVDMNRIGVIGFDMGGMAGQILQMRNSEVDAIMTMDADIVFPHFSGLPGNHPSFDIQKMTAPWIHMTQSIGIEPYRTNLEQSVWGQNSSDGYLMLFTDPNVQHVNFTSYGLLNIPTPLVSYWRENTLPNFTAYSAICKFGLIFMNAYLKNNQTELRRLTDEANSQKPNSIFTLEYKKDTNRGLTFDHFLNQIISGDIVGAVKKVKQHKERNPSWIFYSENSINNIGYRFLYTLNKPEIALEILKLNVDMYPESANAYDSYAEALLRMDKVEEAVENYKKSLELNNENDNARKMLDLLIK